MLDAANQRIANQDALLNQQQNVIAMLYQQQNAGNARIAELEAVCREVVAALELERIEDDIRFAIPYLSGFKTRYDLQGADYDGLFDALHYLLDILPQKA